MNLVNCTNWVAATGEYEESDMEIRRLGWLPRFYKILYARNPSEVGRDGFNEDEIFDNGRRRRATTRTGWRPLEFACRIYDDKIRRSGLARVSKGPVDGTKV